LNNNNQSLTDTAFKQQRLKACQPILTPIPVIITFLVIGIIFVPVGVVMLISSNNVRSPARASRYTAFIFARRCGRC
jgi:hypothetical protein